MRDWTKPFLVSCVVVLGVAVFILEHRISNLESQLSAARSGITAAAPFGQSPTTIAQSQTGMHPLRPEPAITLDLPEPQPAAMQNRLLLEWRRPDQSPVVVVPPQSTARVPPLDRRPSGEINGIPYYHIELSHAGR